MPYDITGTWYGINSLPNYMMGEPESRQESFFEAESTYRLLREVQSGSSEALDQLLRRYLPRLQRWARGRLPAGARDLVDTDDLVQEVLGNAIRHLGRFEYRRTRALQAAAALALLCNSVFHSFYSPDERFLYTPFFWAPLLLMVVSSAGYRGRLSLLPWWLLVVLIGVNNLAGPWIC